MSDEISGEIYFGRHYDEHGQILQDNPPRRLPVIETARSDSPQPRVGLVTFTDDRVNIFFGNTN
jgi:hypothetical protein